MDFYLFCLGVGFCGMLVMAVAGLGHHGHGHGAHGHGRAGGWKLSKNPVHFHGHGHSHGHGHNGPSMRDGMGLMLLGLLSPRAFLSFLLGLGATGLILRPMTNWPPALLLLLAAIGGWAFEQMIVQPFWRFLFGFASNPALTLDTAVQRESTAATDFDADGRGLVSLELDGQMRQMLGRLCPEERAQAAGRVRTGDCLLIQAVDDRRNTCTVSRVRSC